jgi:hypothetical protein
MRLQHTKLAAALDVGIKSAFLETASVRRWLASTIERRCKIFSIVGGWRVPR